ncbi:ribonuclease H-like domain-containing protein [Aspergillus cavernicola]|uniref:Ribonuclease H-like domain-containing protein n=1 Tax=Aspergillus cavernicola TaxID=176166 RepID=A0ABR4IIB8_9EURO
MDSAAEFTPFQQRLTSSLVQATRTVGQVPVGDLSFHRSSNAEVSESLDEQSGRLLSLTSSILKAATAGTDVSAPVLSDQDSIEDNWRGIVDVIDALLERADACLDEFTGVIKKLSPSLQDKDGENKTARKAHGFPTIYDYGPSKISKPQLEFERKVDNTDTSPFKPLLKTKPHAIESLEQSLTPLADARYCNPYEAEIRAAKFPESAYAVSPPIDYLPFESTTATFVDTLDGVKEMLAELKAASEIAIDLEHHDVHAYNGLVSLMQISTRNKDWVVDTLKPWREELQILNEVFADPNILKLFHGSTMDIIWLQRDLGLYVVGMFDTYHAAYALNYPRKSLKYLLQKFVNFEADKRYQMADWRIRPLPSGMFDYARSDTHYLLYIYDNLRNELLEHSTPEENLIDYVQEKSKSEALQRYERPVYDAATGQGAGGWYDLMSRNSAVFSKEQFAVLRAVHEWRDKVAREADEGVQCVFPKHVLFRVAHAMPLDIGTLFRTVSPVTPITKERISDLLEVIQTAKAEGATGPEWRDVYVKPTRGPQAQGLMTPPTTHEGPLPAASRCEVSQFWGAVLDSQTPPLTPPEYSIVASAEARRLSLPLPPMPKTVSEARDKLATQPKQATPPTSTPKEEKEDKNKVFTVKDLGGPRKRKSTQQAEPESTPSSSSEPGELDEISLDIGNDTDSAPLTKKQRRKEKRAQKQNEKRFQNPEDSTPFNYDAADPILNANSNSRSSDRKGKPKSGLPSRRPFDPYKKALEAPSGARKEKREVPGKSFTFR